MKEILTAILETLNAIKKRLDESLPTHDEQSEAWDEIMTNAKAHRATLGEASNPEQFPP